MSLKLTPQKHRSMPLSAATLVVMATGLLAGLLVLAVGYMETRWIVYFCGGLVFLTFLFTLRSQEKLLWVMFVLGFQFDVAVRLLYGHADSSGLSIQFCVVLGGLFLINYFFTRDWSQPLLWLGPMKLTLPLLLAVFVVSTAASSEQFIGVISIITYLQFYLLYFLALNYLRDPQRLEFTVKLLLLILLMQSLVYYIQSALGITFTLTGGVLDETDLPRPGGTVATTPAGFVTFIFPLLLIGAALTLSQHVETRLRLIAGAVSLLGFIALILTFTRGAWAAFAIGAVWLLGFALKRKMMRARMLWPIIIAGVLVAIYALPVILSSRDDNPLEGAFEERFLLMEMAMLVIEAEPWLGVGPGAYGVTFKNYLTPELLQSWLFVVHNTYLLMAAELGIFGGLVFVMWLYAGLALGLKVARRAEPVASHSAAILQAVGLGISASFAALAFELYWEPLNGLYGMTSLVPYWFLLGLLGAQLAANRSTEATRP